MPGRSHREKAIRGLRRHDLGLLTQGAIAGALALGGLVAAIPLKTAAAAYLVVRREVLDQTTGFAGGLGYHLSQMFYTVLPHVQDDLALMRAIRNGTLDPLYDSFGETANVLLLISAAGLTYLSLLYGRILFSRRPAGPDVRSETSLGTVLRRGLLASLLSPLFFHLLVGFTTLLEQYRRLAGLSWETIRPLLRATGQEILDDLGSRWKYTAYAALVGAALFFLLRRPRFGRR
jgi:hypothetical protein